MRPKCFHDFVFIVRKCVFCLFSTKMTLILLCENIPLVYCFDFESVIDIDSVEQLQVV